jgi:hypothetical protein
MVEVSDTALYAAWPPIVLEGKGADDDTGTLDATGRNKRVLYIAHADVTLGQNLTLTGGKADNGGGVYVATGAAFAMSGGSVSGNTATATVSTAGGGGVAVEGGSFVMKGGTISDNQATGTLSNSNGGGVRLSSDGTFTMEGGSVAGNHAGWNGGGIDVNEGFFAMTGGEIRGNDANFYGGGVSVYNGARFQKTGGAIYGSDETDDGSKNTATLGGNAVYVWDGPQKRNTTAGVGVNLDSTTDGTAGGWE